MAKKIIGIDLGTTNSVLSIYEGGEPTVIENQQGSRTTPSVVGYQADGQRVVGQIAKRQAVQNPKNTIFSIKRFMGRRHSEVREEEKLVPYEIVGGSDELVRVKIQDQEYTPPEISAIILRELKNCVEEYLGEEVTSAVITVPAYFNDAQRQATKDAGQIAGLKVERIVNEPTAAALAYGLANRTEGTIAVFDLGGGTFDVSVLEITVVDGETVFEVLATNGDTHLGGDDFDEALLNFVADEFKKEHGIDLRKDTAVLQRLKEACEKAKQELSNVTTTTISLPYVTQDEQKNSLHLNTTITRAKFEMIASNAFRRIYDPCRKCLEDAGLKADEIDEVILVGGSTRIPKVREIAKEIFKKEPSKKLNPDEVVALGAAVQGHILGSPTTANVTFLDVIPLSLGIEIEGGLMAKLIERNTTIPAARDQMFTTTEDDQEFVNIFIYQGERDIAQDNRLLGKFKLEGIPKARRGQPKIKVSFDVDANGILKVSARDMASGREQKVTIEVSSGLSKDDIKRMQEEAEKHAEEDAAKRKEVESRNEAEQLVYGAWSTLSDFGSKITDEERQEITAKVTAVEDILKKENTDVDALTQAKEQAEEALRQLAKAVYDREDSQAESETESDSGSAESETEDSDMADTEAEEVAESNESSED